MTHRKSPDHLESPIDFPDAGSLRSATAKLIGFALPASTLALVLSATVGVCAQPALSLVKSATSSAARDSIVVGSATYLLDLRADTGGNPVSGLQYYINTTPVGVAVYGGTPMTVSGSPFQASDIASSPSAGAIVGPDAGSTILFKDGEGDYLAFADNAIGTYQINTLNLAPGIYVFTPVGEELTYAAGAAYAFAAPGAFTLTILADADGDGMPDAFESANNLNPASAADASKDADGDGAANLQEYLAGTHPGNAASVLRATIQRSAASVQISFVAVANKIYQVEFSDDLSSAAGWTVLAPDLTRSTAGLLQVGDPVAADVRARFYRVRVMR